MDGLKLRHEDGVVEAWLDRGEDNIIAIADCERLIDCLGNPPPGAHVLRLRARGPSFCLGRERRATDVPGLRAEATTLVSLNDALTAGPLVTVAEVAGRAAGFGVGLAVLCHFTLAADDATFSFPEVELGLAPTVVLSWLPDLIGWKNAYRLTATAERVSAEDALRMGLLTAVTSPEALGSTVDDLIALLRRLSPGVHREIADFVYDRRRRENAMTNQLAVERLVTGSLALQHHDGDGQR